MLENNNNLGARPVSGADCPREWMMTETLLNRKEFIYLFDLSQYCHSR
jgi:hypothetical protein